MADKGIIQRVYEVATGSIGMIMLSSTLAGGILYGAIKSYSDWAHQSDLKWDRSIETMRLEAHNSLPAKIRPYDTDRDGVLDREELKNLERALEVAESR